MTPMPHTSEAGDASEQFMTSGDMYSMVLERESHVSGHGRLYWFEGRGGVKEVSSLSTPTIRVQILLTAQIIFYMKRLK